MSGLGQNRARRPVGGQQRLQTQRRPRKTKRWAAPSAAFGLAILLAGCATLEPNPSTVRVYASPRDIPAACAAKGRVAGSGNYGPVWEGIVAAKRDLRYNAASRFHANAVAITATEPGAGAVLAQGLAYRCPAGILEGDVR